MIWVIAQRRFFFIINFTGAFRKRGRKAIAGIENRVRSAGTCTSGLKPYAQHRIVITRVQVKQRYILFITRGCAWPKTVEFIDSRKIYPFNKFAPVYLNYTRTENNITWDFDRGTRVTAAHDRALPRIYIIVVRSLNAVISVTISQYVRRISY